LNSKLGKINSQTSKQEQEFQEAYVDKLTEIKDDFGGDAAGYNSFLDTVEKYSKGSKSAPDLDLLYSIFKSEIYQKDDSNIQNAGKVSKPRAGTKPGKGGDPFAGLNLEEATDMIKANPSRFL
jgi:hypothetical protein